MRRSELVVLSPHADDAALSCGGEIVRRSAEGRRVIVVTICTAPPAFSPGAARLSAFAAEHVARWRASAAGVRGGRPAALAQTAARGEAGAGAGKGDGAGAGAWAGAGAGAGAGAKAGDDDGDSADVARTALEMVALRRAEDRAALRRLGAESIDLEVPDAIFRIAGAGAGGGGGAYPYDTHDALFGPIDPREFDLVDRVHMELVKLPGIDPAAEVLAPLGIGGHVDHRLTRAAAEAWCAHPETRRRLIYYADLPYAAGVALLDEVGLILDPLTPGRRLPARLIALSAEDLAAKIEAVGCYGSQLSTFWTGEAEMAAAVRRWADARAVDPSLPPGRLGEWRAVSAGGPRSAAGAVSARDRAAEPAPSAGGRDRR